MLLDYHTAAAAYLDRSVARRLACTSSISQDGKTKYSTGTVSKFSKSVALVEDLKELQSTIVARRKDRDRECPTDG